MVFLTRVLASAKPNALFTSSFQEFLYKSSGFYKYGLMRDDMLRESDEVTEALRRIPQHIRDERTFRITRALITNASHSILPKEEWMTIEKDVLYLTPYLNEVLAEIKEKEEWDKE